MLGGTGNGSGKTVLDTLQLMMVKSRGTLKQVIKVVKSTTSQSKEFFYL